MTSDIYVEKLQEIFDKKHELMCELNRLTREQSLVITEEGLDELDKLIEKKQAVIDQMIALDEEFDVCFQNLKKELGVNSLDELKGFEIKGIRELQQTISKIMDIVKETIALEKENSAKAKKLLEAFGNEIKKLNQGKRASSAYNPPPIQFPSYFIDRKK